MSQQPEQVETLVIGGGQAGLALGYQLSRRGLPFLIVDANESVGDAWRNRWDSLKLFTPARFDGLPGMPYPGHRWAFPTKDEFADYLARYAKEFDLPMLNGIKVERVTRVGERFLAESGDRRFEAENVVVAMSSWQTPRVPPFASALDPTIFQLHVADYRYPSMLREGNTLVVGAGNSGSEIALELAATRRVFLSGPAPRHLPFRPESGLARVLMPLIGRVIFHRVLTTSTPIGRKARPKMLAGHDLLVRVKPKDLAAAGVHRVPRTTGVEDGLPLLEDGRRVAAANVVWCTGFYTDFSWLELAIHGRLEPEHDRGIAKGIPGLYFVGLRFLYAKSSDQIQGVGRDAAHIAEAIATRRANLQH